MKTTVTEVTEGNVTVHCPCCGAWEEQGIDDPRHHLTTLPIIEWEPDQEGKPEVSMHQCTDCNNQFKVIWDYDQAPSDGTLKQML